MKKFLCPKCYKLLDTVYEYWVDSIQLSAHVDNDDVCRENCEVVDSYIEALECPQCHGIIKDTIANDLLVEVAEDGTIVPHGKYWQKNSLPFERKKEEQA